MPKRLQVLFPWQLRPMVPASWRIFPAGRPYLSNWPLSFSEIWNSVCIAPVAHQELTFKITRQCRMAEIISPPEVRTDRTADRLAAIEAEIRGLRSDMSHQRERMDDRFEAQQKLMDDRFEAQEKLMNDRFEAQEKLMNDRFEAQEKLMNARIDEVKSVTSAQFADVGKQLGNAQVDDWTRCSGHHCNSGGAVWLSGLPAVQLTAGLQQSGSFSVKAVACRPQSPAAAVSSKCSIRLLSLSPLFRQKPLVVAQAAALKPCYVTKEAPCCPASPGNAARSLVCRTQHPIDPDRKVRAYGCSSNGYEFHSGCRPISCISSG